MPSELLNAVFDEVMRQGGHLITRSMPVLKGVINRFAAQYIPDDSIAVGQNVDLTDPTRPSIRDGYAEIGAAQSGISSSAPDLTILRISGFAYLNTTDGTRNFVITIPNATNGKTYWIADSISGGTWAEAVTGVPASYDPGGTDTVIFQANDGLYFLGTGNVFTMSKTHVMYDALDADDTASPDTPKSPPKGGVDGCYFLNRAWILVAGTTTKPPEAHYSKVLPDMTSPSTQWARTSTIGDSGIAGRLQLSPNWGSTAVAIKPWNQVSLIVFFDNNIEEVIVNSADPEAGSTRRILEPRFGTRSRDSIVTIGQEMYFLDQFGEFRSLQQTVNAEQSGVVPRPVSEPIQDELPNNLNMAHLDKVRAVAYRDKIYVWYPRLGETEATSVVVFDTSLRVWIGAPWRMEDSASRVLVSNIRSTGTKGEEMYFADGAAAVAKVYRMFTGSYTDNGTAIQYSEETKAYDGGIPESDKTPSEFELEAKGAQGAIATVSVKVEEGGGWQALPGQLEIPGNAASSFPLVPSSFALVPASFPLVDAEPGLVRQKFHLHGLTNFGKGRTHQFRIQASESGKLFRRTGFRFIYRPEKYEEE